MALNFQTSTLCLTLPISCQICLGKVTTEHRYRTTGTVEHCLTARVLLNTTKCCGQHQIVVDVALSVIFGELMTKMIVKVHNCVCVCFVVNGRARGLQVRQPVICANHHVFCSSCMEMWLKKANQCPTCRVPITADNPCREIIGE